MSEFTLSNRLCGAAQQWANQLSQQNGTGHGNMSQRVNEAFQGNFVQASAENIAFGAESAAEAVAQLIVDGGVANRGHRTNLFTPNCNLIGVGWAPHGSYGTVCVMDFAAFGGPSSSHQGGHGQPVNHSPQAFAQELKQQAAHPAFGQFAQQPGHQVPSQGMHGQPNFGGFDPNAGPAQVQFQTFTKNGVTSNRAVKAFTTPEGQVVTMVEETHETHYHS